MSEFRFSKDIFKCVGKDAQFCADLAQAALDEYLKTCRKTYGFVDDVGFLFDGELEDGDTHEAILFNLRPIEKPECEHDPVVELEKTITSATISPGKVGFSFWSQSKWWCSKCGAKLKAKWEAVKNER